MNVYENVVPVNLDKPQLFLFYKQRYAFLLTALLGIAFYVCIKYSITLIPFFVFLLSFFAFVLIQVNDFYTIGFLLFSFLLHTFIYRLEYYNLKGCDTFVKTIKHIKQNKAKVKNHQKKLQKK